MEAEWEDGAERENKLDHVFKVNNGKRNLNREKGVGGKTLHGERGERSRRETGRVRCRKRRGGEGRRRLEIKSDAETNR